MGGSGTLAGGPILEVQPYKVTSETCFSSDCEVSITPSLSSLETSGTEISNAGTCQLFATDVATPTSPLAPDGISYRDGCQWQSRDISVTDNTFAFQPSLISVSSPLNGGNTTACDANHACGTNFMAFQQAGVAPFSDLTDGNAMMSSTTFTGCPLWDSGCTTNPLNNLNALSNAPDAVANNGETPYNNVWSDNTYSGPWGWNTYIYGNCFLQPSDPNTGKSIPSGECGTLNFNQWQSYWQQENSSTYNPLLVTLEGIATGQDIHGPSQSVTGYEDTGTSGGISGNLLVNSSNISNLSGTSSAVFRFNLNTLNYPDGSYTVAINGIDAGDNVATDSASTYITNGDLNGDDKVSLSDLAILAAHWGQNDSNYSDGNITGQSTINNSDLTVMASNWKWSK